MLTIPQDAPTCVTVLGIDPGSTKLGLCLLTVDMDNLEIVKTDAFTLKVVNYTDKDDGVVLSAGERVCKLNSIAMRIKSILYKNYPYAIGCEHPYFNQKTPNAFGSLKELTTTISKAVYEYDPLSRLNLIDPSSVKNAIGAPGNCNKEIVLQEIKKLITSGVFGICPDPDTLDDNAIDSIAVAYVTYKRSFQIWERSRRK